MTTEFNSRAAHDRPLNDRFSDVSDDKTEFEEPRTDDNAELAEPRADDKAVINDDEPVYADAETQETAVPQQEETRARLFGNEETEQFRSQWREVQAQFVDEPRTAVRDADSLLSSMLDELKSHVDEQKRTLDGGWDRDTKDTEELRVAMQRYRSLFDQILSA